VRLSRLGVAQKITAFATVLARERGIEAERYEIDLTAAAIEYAADGG